MAPKEIVSDFSSPEYWSNRFMNEKSFEWLANSPALGPIILELIKDLIQTRDAPLNILHFGCGTSSLGPDLVRLLREQEISARVVDADYVAEFIPPNPRISADNKRNGVPLINLDVLDSDQLAATVPDGGWDLLLDKSTADAISCGPSMPWRSAEGEEAEIEEIRTGNSAKDAVDTSENDDEGDEELFEPIHILCDTLASVTRLGGKWFCISYSSTRFDHLKSPSHPSHSAPNNQISPTSSGSPIWRLISAQPIDGAFTGKPSTVSDEAGGKRVVYAPETNVWGYILERI